ncbi:MAG: fused response regulator/thioredoxin-disulfide reductase [Bryobacterales bacterium]|nr:fused response regulator/thioredoxin-disulfide reductase [Bryobacterales bacterium]
MAKPAVLTVDDDPEVLRSVERDLRKRYSEKYRVMRADSGKAALDLLRDLRGRNDALALMLVDQRMPQMDGVAFLTQAMTIYPEAKRAMLTAYADTDAAIKAINEAKIQHYLLKPWDPPEQNLYPVLDDLLEDWLADYRPPFTGLRVLGDRWSPKSFELRDFLSRNHVPFKWMDAEAAERDPEIRQTIDAIGEDAKHLPVALFQDGTRMAEPKQTDVAEKIGLRTRAQTTFYQVLIVGGGPAGLAAAVYGASEGLTTVMVEREAPGGQAGLSSRIENYLGFPSGLSGGDLARRAVAQARRFGVEIISPQEATSVRVDGPYRFVKLSDGSELSCHALLLAMGVQWRKLDVPGLDRFTGAGVYYGAASTEAMSCKDEDVYVVGGANSAGQAAMFFSRYARRVVMLVRGPSLSSTMSHYLIGQIEHTENIHVEVNSSVVEAFGDTRLEEIAVHCTLSGETNRVNVSSLFIFIGAVPNTNWLDSVVERDEKGFILSGAELKRNGKQPRGWPLERDPGLLETSVPGIFVVGDVRRGSVKRVASGVGEGSIAIQFVHQYLGNI